MRDLIERFLRLNEIDAFNVDGVSKMIGAGYWSLDTAFKYFKLSHDQDLDERKIKVYWFSPLVPNESGVANLYAQQILPFLSLLFDITIVQVSGAWSANFFNLRTIELSEFESEHDTNSILILNIGNNPFHKWMNSTLKTRKTICVIHDVFVGHERLSALDNSIKRIVSLAKAEGYMATDDKIQQLILHHPFIRNVVTNSGAIIAHSNYAAGLIEKNVNSEFSRGKNLFVTPLFRQVRNILLENEDITKKMPETVVCFGNVAPHKLSKEALLGFLRSNAFNRGVQFIFAGRTYVDNYCEEIKQLVKEYDAESWVVFTDYISEKDYKEIALNASIAIQLRTNSRGESSGAVVDCFSYLIPTILNHHASFQESDLKEVYMLDEYPTIESISTAIDQLLSDSRVTDAIKGNMYRNNLMHNAVTYAKILEKVVCLVNEGD